MLTKKVFAQFSQNIAYHFTVSRKFLAGRIAKFAPLIIIFFLEGQTFPSEGTQTRIIFFFPRKVSPTQAKPETSQTCLVDCVRVRKIIPFLFLMATDLADVFPLIASLTGLMDYTNPDKYFV